MDRDSLGRYFTDLWYYLFNCFAHLAMIGGLLRLVQRGSD